MAEQKQTTKKTTETEELLLLDESGVAGYVIPDELIQKLGTSAVERLDIDLEKEKTVARTKQPKVEGAQTTKISLYHLNKALLLAKKAGYNYVEISLKSQEPVKLVYSSTLQAEKVVKKPLIQWIAPYVD